jgi:phosphocarrier protein FPr/phosphocarrier protein
MPAAATQIEILAPLSGVLVPLESVPDPVFSQKMVGDGISIDPTSGDLLAPVAGIVTQLHRANHALTITTEQGLEVLLHIGLDTVTLKGDGFAPKVKQGDHVEIGQTLISFDADLVALKARSLLSQILIANVEKVARFIPSDGMAVAGKSVVLTLELAGAKKDGDVTGEEADEAAVEGAGEDIAEGAGEKATGNTITGDEISLPNPSGLHARPAAVLATEAKKFASDVRMVRGSDKVNAKSVVAIMGLATQQGDAIRIVATGADAEEAVRTISALLADGCGEKEGDAPEPAAAVAAPVAAPAAPAVRATAASDNELVGVPASPGLAVGHVVQYHQEILEVSETGESPALERGKLHAALRNAHDQIEALKPKLPDPSKSKILDAHQVLLDDPDLIDLAINGIDQGKSAGFAWRAAFTEYANRLEKLEGDKNALLRERGNDIRDVGRRVLALLAGVKQARIDVPEGSILIAVDLAPSDTASLDRSKVLGFCTTAGGSTSHVAILARSLGIPAICGIDEAALTLDDGAPVVLDGSKGLLYSNPSEAEITQANERIARQAGKREKEKAESAAPAITTDGHHIEVVANVRNAQEAKEGVANGAEGVGLLRSEFLFDNRETAPDEEEQAVAYIDVAETVGRERPLVVRTLDVGGDKPLSYMPLPKENNPFLGLRGVRVSLDQPEMFRTQLRAILRAARLTRLHIMFPMIATLEELREAKAILAAILAEEHAATGFTKVQVGVMIEVPSAAIMAEQFAREADFFSIGTNDLTQYALAMDRSHPKLAKKADALNPAVLKMIALTCEGARKHGKWVGVCGGMASDAMAVPVLIGLGVDELSVSVPAIPAIKALVRRLSFTECELLAQEVIQMGTASEVRERLAVFTDSTP